jgi:Arc/MetJ family transcription regulator
LRQTWSFTVAPFSLEETVPLNATLLPRLTLVADTVSAALGDTDTFSAADTGLVPSAATRRRLSFAAGVVVSAMVPLLPVFPVLTVVQVVRAPIRSRGRLDIHRDTLAVRVDISGGVRMSRTVIDLDDELLADVAQALGTGTKKETVNTALREVLENRRRALALTRLRAAAGDGGFDLDLFEDKRDYRR